MKFDNKLEAWLTFLCMDEVMQMLRRVYAKLQNMEETAQLVDCSVEEVEAAVKGLNEE